MSFEFTSRVCDNCACIYSTSTSYSCPKCGCIGYKDAVPTQEYTDDHEGEDSVYPPSALDVQVGGSHYKDMVIQPTEYCQRNQLNWCESNIVKYASRHKSKGGAEDVRKIIHYAQLLLKLEYNEDS